MQNYSKLTKQVNKAWNIPLALMLDLFENSILSILLYDCVVWGFENLDVIEMLHSKFCKISLGVKKPTASSQSLQE